MLGNKGTSGGFRRAATLALATDVLGHVPKKQAFPRSKEWRCFSKPWPVSTTEK